MALLSTINHQPSTIPPTRPLALSKNSLSPQRPQSIRQPKPQLLTDASGLRTWSHASRLKPDLNLQDESLMFQTLSLIRTCSQPLNFNSRYSTIRMLGPRNRTDLQNNSPVQVPSSGTIETSLSDQSRPTILALLSIKHSSNPNTVQGTLQK